MQTDASSLPAPAVSAEGTDFAVEELFFSTTDRKGVITSCNRVFERVAGYTETELIGKAHNVVRHPDMPRAVFQQLWDTIGAGRPVAAFVKNRRKDGSFYWVLASVVPVDGGYLSIRLKPTSGLLAAVEPVYQELRALELGIESGDGKARKRAIEASLARLGELLPTLGYESYGDFMRAALPAELTAREARRERRERRDTALPAGADELLSEILVRIQRTGAWLDSVFTNLGAYETLNAELAQRSAFVGELADSVSLFSLNALVKATRLGDRAAALGAVADLMGQRSRRINATLGELTGEIAQTVDLLHGISFEIALCKLQTEMAAGFAVELIEAGETEPHRQQRVRADIAMLTRKVAEEVEALAAGLAKLDTRLDRIRRGAAALCRELEIMGALRMNGKVEAAHLHDADDIEALFDQIRDQVEEAVEKSSAFLDLTRTGGERGSRVPAGLERDIAQLRVLAEQAVALPAAA